MADAFASSAVIALGGLGIDEWLARNFSFTDCEGEELVDAYTLSGPAVLLGQRKRKECAIILQKPEKWRAMALSWYYEPWRCGDPEFNALGSLNTADAGAGSLAPSGLQTPTPVNPDLLRIVSYCEAMSLSGKPTCSRMN